MDKICNKTSGSTTRKPRSSRRKEDSSKKAQGSRALKESDDQEESSSCRDSEENAQIKIQCTSCEKIYFIKRRTKWNIFCPECRKVAKQLPRDKIFRYPKQIMQRNEYWSEIEESKFRLGVYLRKYLGIDGAKNG